MLVIHFTIFDNETDVFSRTPISISRDGTMGPKLCVPVLQIVGAGSAFVGDSVELNARLNPADSEWLKVSPTFIDISHYYIDNIYHHHMHFSVL